MSQNTLTNLELAALQVKSSTPESVIKMIATQMDRLDAAKKRIEDEGIVVRDLKGSVIAHPAMKIESDASKLLADLLYRNKKL